MKPNTTGLTRRTVLDGLVGATALGVFGSLGGAGEPSDSYTVVQGGECHEVTPLSGDQRVEELYGLQIPDAFGGENGATDEGGPYYRSEGTRDLQRRNTTITFLYDGPRGIHLVVVHDAPDGTGGSASWLVNQRPETASWIVADDRYIDPDTGTIAKSNYDRWDTDGRVHRIDWTWGGRATDGGVLGPLDGVTDVRIVPAYNEKATLWEQYYEGRVTDWQFLSGSRSNPNRIDLDLHRPVALSRRDCVRGGRRGRGGPGDDEEEREDEDEEEREDEDDDRDDEDEDEEEREDEDEDEEEREDEDDD